MDADTDAGGSIGELASALYRLLPASGDRSFWSVADRLGLSRYWNSPDKARALRQLIEGARRERAFGEFIESAVIAGIAQCREDGVPVTQDELSKIVRATEALGVSVPSLRDPLILHQSRPEPESRREEPRVDPEAEERRRRVLRAHAELYSNIFTGSADERLLKLANVLGGLAMANGARVEQPPRPQNDSVHATVRLGSQEYAIEARWSPEQVEEGLDTLAQRVLGSNERRAMLVIVDGFPDDLVLDADKDRWTTLLDGHDLTLLLEDRWTLQDALKFKDVQQRETGAHVPLPLALPAEEAPAPAPAPVAEEAEEAEPQEPSDLPVPGGEQVIPPNPMDFDRSIDDELESAESEERRLRLIRRSLLAVVVVGIGIALLVMRGIQGAEQADLEAAERALTGAVQARTNALRNLDAGGLERYFNSAQASQIADLVERLRAQGVYLTSSDEVEVMQASMEEGLAFIAVQETVRTEVRRTGTGEIVQSQPAQTQTIGFVLEKGTDGRWRVIDLRVLG